MHEHLTQQPKGVPTTVQVHTQHKLLLQLSWRCIDQLAPGAHEPIEPDANSPSEYPITPTSLKKAVPLHAHVYEVLVEFKEPKRSSQKGSRIKHVCSV